MSIIYLSLTTEADEGTVFRKHMVYQLISFSYSTPCNYNLLHDESSRGGHRSMNSKMTNPLKYIMISSLCHVWYVRMYVYFMYEKEIITPQIKRKYF